jgi:hypothetical protein
LAGCLETTVPVQRVEGLELGDAWGMATEAGRIVATFTDGRVAIAETLGAAWVALGVDRGDVSGRLALDWPFVVLVRSDGFAVHRIDAGRLEPQWTRPLPADFDWNRESFVAEGGWLVTAERTHISAQPPAGGPVYRAPLPEAAGYFAEVAMDGSRLVVGVRDYTARHQDGTTSPEDGLVLVYHVTAQGLEREAVIRNPDSRASGRFGSSVTIEGNLLAVGSSSEGAKPRIHIFSLDGADWELERTHVLDLPMFADAWIGLADGGLAARVGSLPEGGNIDLGFYGGWDNCSLAWWSDASRSRHAFLTARKDVLGEVAAGICVEDHDSRLLVGSGRAVMLPGP